MIAETTYADSVALRPVASEDLPMLAEWMGRPHVQEWWGPVETEIAGIRAKVEGRDTTRPFIFEIDGKPAGYAQSSFFDDHKTPDQLAKTPWLDLLPTGSVGIDLFIAEDGSLSKGIGSSVVRMMAEMLRREGHRHILIDPDPANTRAVRAYEKAGFRVMPELVGKTGDFLLMRFDPQRAEIRAKD